MAKDDKHLADRTRLSNIIAVAYVLNRSFCANPDRKMKLEEIMSEVAEHLTNDLDEPNEILENIDKEKRQFRRYIEAVSASIVHVESTTGKNGGYRLEKNIQAFPLFTNEECTMLSLTLPRSDLLKKLKEKPSIQGRLNQELVYAGYSINEDVLYGLMDAVDAIERHKKVELINYEGNKTKHDKLIISPVAIRWFKGAYYVVCVSKKKDGGIFFWDCRFEKAEAHNPCEEDITIAYSQTDLANYIDEEAFGLHRGDKSERKKYLIETDDEYVNRVQESLDHKVSLVKKENGKTIFEVIAYGKNEIDSYLHALIYCEKPKVRVYEAK